MKYNKVKAFLSTAKGKAVTGMIAAGLVIGGTAIGVTAHDNAVEQARLEEAEEAEELQAEMDADAAKEVDADIDAIGEVTPDSGNAITKAEDAYGKLSDAQKKLVLKYDTLKEARAAYDSLVAAKDTAEP